MIDWPEVVDLAQDATWGGMPDADRAESYRRIGELMCERGGVDWVVELMQTNRRLLAELEGRNGR